MLSLLYLKWNPCADWVASRFCLSLMTPDTVLLFYNGHIVKVELNRSQSRSSVILRFPPTVITRWCWCHCCARCGLVDTDYYVLQWRHLLVLQLCPKVGVPLPVLPSCYQTWKLRSVCDIHEKLGFGAQRPPIASRRSLAPQNRVFVSHKSVNSGQTETNQSAG